MWRRRYCSAHVVDFMGCIGRASDDDMAQILESVVPYNPQPFPTGKYVGVLMKPV